MPHNKNAAFFVCVKIIFFIRKKVENEKKVD